MNKLLDLALDLSRELRTLKAFVQWENRKFSERISDEWIDGEQVMAILKISKRTLQNLRDNGVLPYSKVKGKFFYKTVDLKAMLEANYLKKDCTNLGRISRNSDVLMWKCADVKENY